MLRFIQWNKKENDFFLKTKIGKTDFRDDFKKTTRLNLLRNSLKTKIYDKSILNHLKAKQKLIQGSHRSFM